MVRVVSSRPSATLCVGMYNYCEPDVNEVLPFATFQIITYIFLSVGSVRIRRCPSVSVGVCLRLAHSLIYPSIRSTRSFN